MKHLVLCYKIQKMNHNAQFGSSNLRKFKGFWHPGIENSWTIWNEFGVNLMMCFLGFDLQVTNKTSNYDLFHLKIGKYIWVFREVILTGNFLKFEIKSCGWQQNLNLERSARESKWKHKRDIIFCSHFPRIDLQKFLFYQETGKTTKMPMKIWSNSFI